jgi:hypothetical protein
MLCYWPLMGPPATPSSQNFGLSIVSEGEQAPKSLVVATLVATLLEGWQTPGLRTLVLVVLPPIE